MIDVFEEWGCTRRKISLMSTVITKGAVLTFELENATIGPDVLFFVRRTFMNFPGIGVFFN